MNQASIQSIKKITGVIEKYSATRGEARFVFNDHDQTALGMTAVAAGFAGLSGQAIATASNASNLEEEADFLTFEIAGRKISGWIWRSPFKEGDAVEVLGQDDADSFELVAITRPADRVIALYPHCSRGTGAHVKNAAKWWAIGSIASAVLLHLIALTTGTENYWEEVGRPMLLGSAGVAAFFALMTVSLAMKWMPFVQTAEMVFAALGWRNAKNVDLVKSSKALRKAEDPGEYGTFYFRY
jgi:hypothetical protein